jgi:hypothetical protein
MHATLASMQGALAEIYDLAATPDVAQFLMTDRASVAGFEVARESDEQQTAIRGRRSTRKISPTT